MQASQPPGVFISYRRQDAAFHAGWLYEQLVGKFGKPYVFKDVDSIEPGQDFINVITTAVRSCHTLLVVIGPKWLSISDKEAVRRIEKLNDFVRLEIEIALEHGIDIIPVLVLDAVMPTPDELPRSVAGLARRNAIEITSSHFQADLLRLMRVVDRIRRDAEAGITDNSQAHIRCDGADEQYRGEASDLAQRDISSAERRSPPGGGSGKTPRLLGHRYELGEVLGYGTMSVVHRGHDTRSGRDVAVKVLRAELARNPQDQARFRRELQNATAPSHPAIVAVYDLSEVASEFGPTPYTVMEYVDGQTLREIAKTAGPMRQRRAIEVIVDVCTALEFSHRHNVLHQNINPANIMITRAGAVKVMDFGSAGAQRGNQSIAETAAVISSAQYLSPEQARGERVDARSDVYAIGCVLFELVTGEPPFAGDSPVAATYQHVRETPQPPSELNQSISPALDAVVLKALSKNPVNRYQSAGEMRSDLERVHGGRDPLAPAATSREACSTRLASGPPIGPTRELDGGVQTTDPPQHVRGARPPRDTATMLRIAVAVLVMLGLIGFVANRLSSSRAGPRQVAVPSLIGAAADEAGARLEAARLRVGIVRQVPSEATEFGKVTANEPAAGSLVSEQSSVELSVGDGSLPAGGGPPPTGGGPAQVTVPQLVGLSVADATRDLARAGLKVGSQTQGRGAAGKIISTDPGAGTAVKDGSAVNVVIGTQEGSLTVPDVVGLAAATAQGKLETAGFVVKREDVDSGGDSGTVVGTKPPAGTKAKKGSTVTLQITIGNSAPRVPDVLGQSQDDAERTLQAAGFTAISVTSQPTPQPEQVGLVIAQSPTAGQTAASSDIVQLVVGQQAERG